MNNEELLAKYKALFPDNVEAIVVRKDDYDRLYGDLTIENIELKQEIERLHSIIKEVREYITSYESIETIQQCEHSEKNKDLDEKTLNEMTRRYLIVHDKILEILDKADKE